MAKVIFALGIVTGLAILGIAVAGAPQSSGVEARQIDLHGSEARAASMSNAGCGLREIELDQGYGVSRKILRRVCPMAE